MVGRSNPLMVMEAMVSRWSVPGAAVLLAFSASPSEVGCHWMPLAPSFQKLAEDAEEKLCDGKSTLATTSDGEGGVSGEEEASIA